MNEIVIRPYRKEDLPAIQALHKAQGLNYAQPNWDTMLLGGVLERDGKAEMAIFLRKTCEAYLLLDPQAEFRKRERLGQFLALHEEMIPAAVRKELSDVHCWLPPEMEKEFGRILQKHLQWAKQLWPCYQRQLNG